MKIYLVSTQIFTDQANVTNMVHSISDKLECFEEIKKCQTKDYCFPYHWTFKMMTIDQNYLNIGDKKSHSKKIYFVITQIFIDQASVRNNQGNTKHHVLNLFEVSNIHLGIIR